MQKEDYVSLFGLLAGEKVIDILLFLGSLDKETYVVLDVISNNVGLSVKETKKYFGDKSQKFDYWWEVGEYLQKNLVSKATILIKGSQNTIFLEELVKSLLKNKTDSSRPSPCIIFDASDSASQPFISANSASSSAARIPSSSEKSGFS